MLRYWEETLILVCASIWIIVGLRRICLGRDLGDMPRRTVWLPLSLAGLVVLRRIYQTRAMFHVLQEGGAISERQRQLFVDVLVDGVVTVITLGAILSGILWAIARFGKQRTRRPQ